jgi:CDP-diacylglycerol--serine O-phosphatidyltransferase
MMALARRKRRRPNVRRAVILFPSGLTLGNLFFGVFAIIAASRLEFVAAGVYVLLGGICDALDGRVARATNAGSEFGEELDSLVDAITFGLAPGMIMYFAVLNRSGWDWVWVFLFAACAVLRLARFNIEQAGSAKMYFQGLPSPAAGITLASYYWFSQSSLYTYGAIGDLPWQHLLRYLMFVLAILMISNVPYPVFPRTGFRSLRSIGATLLLIGSIVLLATKRLEYFFPFALIYVAWGLLRWVLSGLFERRQPTIPYDLSEGEDDEDEDEDEDEELDSEVHATRRSHRLDRSAGLERGDRGERSEQPRPRTERAPGRTAVAERATERTERAERPERTERGERGARAERPERGERTERGGRTRDGERTKREGRQKERPRKGERPAREEKATQAAIPVAITDEPAASGVDAITLGQSEGGAALAPAASPVLNSGAGASTTSGEGSADALAGPSAPPPAEGSGAPRKRKRRRRRGDRKERAGAADDSSSPAEQADGDDHGDHGDHGGDDAGSGDDAGNDAVGPYREASGNAQAAPPTATTPQAPQAPSEAPLLLPRSPSEPTE